MCEACEISEELREAYLARRARMAQTWTPKRRWPVVTPTCSAVVPVPVPAQAVKEPVAAE